MVGSGCGTVGRVVVSDTRGPGFEYGHLELLLNNNLLLTAEKDGNKEKRGREWSI